MLDVFFPFLFFQAIGAEDRLLLAFAAIRVLSLICKLLTNAKGFVSSLRSNFYT